MFEKLWDEYFYEKCLTVVTDEEREILKKTADLRKTVDGVLTSEQIAALDKYIEALSQMQSIGCKKALLNGCRFTVAFLNETKGGSL